MSAATVAVTYHGGSFVVDGQRVNLATLRRILTALDLDPKAVLRAA